MTIPKKKIKAVIASTRVEDGINYNLRAKMYWECLQWLKDEPNALPNDPELKVQMSSIKYRFKGGLRLICSKKEEETKDMAESVSGSPDRADSLALGFAFPPELNDYKPPSIPAPAPFDRTGVLIDQVEGWAASALRPRDSPTENACRG